MVSTVSVLQTNYLVFQFNLSFCQVFYNVFMTYCVAVLGTLLLILNYFVFPKLDIKTAKKCDRLTGNAYS
jgi:hypothetical protein